MNLSIKYLLRIFLIITSLYVKGQGTHTRDSTFLDHANTYINKKLGKEFVKKNLRLLRLYNAGLSVVAYETITTKNPEGRNTMLIYFRTMTYEVDTVLSVLLKDEILKSIRGDSTCKLYIGMEKARKIAKDNGLQQGVKPWVVGMMNVLPQQIPKWTFDATYTSHGAYSTGAELQVNMTDGKYSMSDWSERP
ncbi:MAG TPA: hypothetical protein VK808_07140 [Bacteroidia bacterium]|jgi:hypothetical protein|nr:hypothetical protein [Bacteroidia bacterium]